MIDKIICDECAHAEICKYREEYKRVSAAVENLTIKKALSNGAQDIRKVSDIPYIDVILDCKYLRRAPNATVKTTNISNGVTEAYL